MSTPTDMTQFIEALFMGKLVSKQSLDQMTTITDGYGMGMIQFPLGTKRAYGHNGSIDGFASMLAYFPAEKLVIAYCTNGQAYPINDIMIGVLSIYFQVPYQIPRFKAAPILSPAEIARYAGMYASTQMPLKIEVTAKGAALQAQATGQPALPLTLVDKDTFTFDPAGIRMVFAPDRREMLLKQGGRSYLFKME